MRNGAAPSQASHCLALFPDFSPLRSLFKGQKSKTAVVIETISSPLLLFFVGSHDHKNAEELSG